MPREKIKTRKAQVGGYAGDVDYEGMDPSMHYTLTTSGQRRRLGGAMPAQSNLMAEFAGRLGFPHTPAIEASFKVRGRRAYKGY